MSCFCFVEHSFLAWITFNLTFRRRAIFGLPQAITILLVFLHSSWTRYERLGGSSPGDTDPGGSYHYARSCVTIQAVIHLAELIDSSRSHGDRYQGCRNLSSSPQGHTKVAGSQAVFTSWDVCCHTLKKEQWGIYSNDAQGTFLVLLILFLHFQ